MIQKSSRKTIVYIASSLDGYIAKPNDDLGFLSIVEKEGEDYGYFNFVGSIDTVIMGRKTFDWVMTQVPEFPHADKETYIITRTPKASVGNITFYNGDLRELVARLKAKPGKDIFVDGGAEMVNQLLCLRLIDEIIVSVIPVLLGGGTPLFQPGIPELQLELVNSHHYDTGLVQLHYRCKTQ